MDPKKAKSIFLQAVEQYAPIQWPAYLDEACGEDTDLRHGVELLLAAHQENVDLAELGRAAWNEALPTIDQPALEQPGTEFGPYRLLQVIGQGGMGVVYMAEQDEPVQRRVALKIIKSGMDSRQVVGRFDAERQALSLMDHPNIARVLDAGTTESGRPYFVMEWVKGAPITQYCDEHHLGVRERLELFIQVCHAVQHAHQKGIIHRDIKPSNVLVAEYDDRPVPKIIDFGVAKAIDHRLTEQTMSTQLGQVVGTIDYMSPEQAKLNQPDIDTRSDIYSLGVLLYELLTGETPVDSKRLRSAAFDDMLRMIREEEPQRPSLRLSNSDLLPSIAAIRQTEPKKLSTLVRGELDWIVMKALEKDRSRRYETANGLAHDVENYLHDEPVLACPPSAVYRLRKFARRNKGPVAAVSLVLLALVAGIIGTMLGLLEARTQRQEAEASEKYAAEEAAVANAVNGFLQQDLLGLAGADAQVVAQIEPDPNLKLTTLLDRAAAKVDERFADQPRVRAEVQDTLARAYYSIGRYADAVRLWEQVRGYGETVRPEHPATLAAMNSLAEAYGSAGQYKKALELAQETLDLKRKILGPEHPETLKGMYILATIYERLGRHADALKLHEQTLGMRMARLGPDHHDTLQSMNGLANSYYHLRRDADALKLYEETFALIKAKLGPAHPDTLASMENLANCYDALGRHAEALKVQEQTLALKKASLGPDHPATLHSMGNVAICYGNLKRHTEALKLNEETLALKRARLGPDHPDTLKTMDRLACSYGAVGRHAEGLKLHEEVLALRKARLGPDHPDTLRSMSNVAACYSCLSRDAEGVKLGEDALALQRAKLGPNHPDTLQSINSVAGCYSRLGRHADALKLYEETLAFRESTLGPDHPLTLWAMVSVATSLDRLNRGAEAVPIIDECVKRAVGKPVPPGVFTSMIALRVRQADRTKDAAGWRAMAEMFEKLKPPNAESRYNVACLRAILATIIRAGDKSDAAIKDATAEADRAMAWLKEAVATGFKDINLMKTDKDLDVLRDREDFKKLLAELEADQQKQKK